MDPNQIAESQAGIVVNRLQDLLAMVTTDFTSTEWGVIKKEVKDAVREAVNQTKQEMRRSGSASNGNQSELEKGKPFYSGGDMFPFGKHGPKDGNPKTFDEVPDGYWRWLMSQEWIDTWPGIVRFANGETEENLPPLPEEDQVEGASSEIPF